MKSRSIFALVIGPLISLVTVLLETPTSALTPEGWRALGLTAWMALWWMTECAPLAVTALLPLVFGTPLGLGSMDEIGSSYGHPLIFLFLGGFLLSLGMEQTGLHRRMAKAALRATGPVPKWQVAGVMGVTAFLSMWMSNTATAVMMLPIAQAIIRAQPAVSGGTMEASRAFPVALLLGIAYGASIGGMATLIGTPPNAFLAAYLADNHGVQIGFAHWMLFGVPLSTALLVVSWWWLTREIRGEPAANATSAQPDTQRAWSGGERWVLIVFLTAIGLWVFRVPLVDWTGIPLSDTAIAIGAGGLLFLLPGGVAKSGKILEWSHTGKLPWGVLLLFGGGLALAKMIRNGALDASLGAFFLNLESAPRALVLVGLILAVIALTEITSNTATTATLLPLLTPLAVVFGGSPSDFAVPIALAASCAFMMPVATPPNAIVFGTGDLAMRDFVRHGVALNLFAGVVLIVAAVWLVPVLF